jgi:hypothetical protein
MAYQKLQVSSAVAVIPSDYINIPNVAASFTSQTTGSYATGLEDTNANFTDPANQVQIGDIVYETTSLSIIGRVISIDSATELSLDDGNGTTVTIGATRNYAIYKNSSNGCVLYVGVAGDVKVEMANGTIVTFTAAANGYHPIQVKKVFATDTAATNIVALW